jgi:probable selenium-dependent hydroxylase accessory protein YqeC
VYAFVGAGGKTTAIAKVAEMSAALGVRVRITTTTRLGAEELTAHPRVIVDGLAAFLRAVDSVEPVCVIVSGRDGAANKLLGVDARFIDAVRPRADLLLLVEADGSRRRPLKMPADRDPVIPRSAAAVVGLMGASGFGEPITEDTCFNHEAALRLLGKGSGTFDAESLARIALNAEGLRKGVLPGMGFHVVINQADIASSAAVARGALAAIRAGGADATLLSWREERVYEQP